MNLLTTLDYDFDRNKVIKEVFDIVNSYPTFGPKISLTHSELTAHRTIEERLLESFSDASQTEEHKYNLFIEEFKGTELHSIFETVPNIGRFRIMILQPMSCYNIHSDVATRYHFVIDTNPSCLFVYPNHNEVFHIPCDGKLYLVNTLEPHTFVNCGDTVRIHLVLTDLANYIH